MLRRVNANVGARLSGQPGMNQSTHPRPARDRRATARKISGEAGLVLAAGLAFALAANAISPLGLKLGRNYFPAGTAKPIRPVVTAAPSRNVPGTNPAAQLLAVQMKELGLQIINGRQAAQLFRDPRRAQGIIVFVDARDEPRYRDGHIPGAYEFDPYRPEKYLAAVLPVCQKAGQIVVYCNGGDCDDSVSAAMSLREAGIDNQKLFVYAGGMSEWTNSMPIVTGGRNGENLSRPAQ